MKLLTREELGGIESTSKTIAKWDEFFKKALPNLGYRQETMNQMYPYENGIPMKDGTYMPVPKDTGRVFFQMSWADKLAGEITALSGVGLLQQAMLRLWRIESVFKTFFPEKDFSNYDSSNLNDDSLARECWRTFIDNSDIVLMSLHMKDKFSSQGKIPVHIRERIRERVPNDTRCADAIRQYKSDGYSIFLYCHLIENVFSPFPGKEFKDICKTQQSSEIVGRRLDMFDEVYLQDYLVVSLNPIDKFMCSTKQAFSSCISIAKQNDTRGTSSVPAFGLPALFPSESVFMVYLTPGKHKNMYFSGEEWQKVPEERDKDKAYKYLKMTCRALTYKGTLTKQVKADIEKIANAEITEAFKKVCPDQPRLMVGRQYSAKGEDNIWQPLIEWLLAKRGISTSMAYADEIAELRECIYQNVSRDQMRGKPTIDIWNTLMLRTGEICDTKSVCTDRYGYLRGIYYDNVVWNLKPKDAQDTGAYWYYKPTKENLYPCNKTGNTITVGCSRTGSGQITHVSPLPGLDMFKVMTGIQSYTHFHQHIKVCSECGEVIIGKPVQYNGKTLCDKCLAEKNLKKCEYCNEIYDLNNPDDVAKHELYNIKELTNPTNYKKLEPKYLCANILSKCDLNKVGKNPDGRPLRAMKAICAHCGNIIPSSDYSPGASVYADFHGMQLRVGICVNCLRKAVMCDKCKRVVFLESFKDACILLPNRRVVCPDCINSIRMAQEMRTVVRNVINDLQPGDLKKSEGSNPEALENKIGLECDKIGVDLTRRDTLIKDIEKQILSYLQAHPDKESPVLKESNVISPQEAEEAEQIQEETGGIPEWGPYVTPQDLVTTTNEIRGV